MKKKNGAVYTHAYIHTHILTHAYADNRQITHRTYSLERVNANPSINAKYEKTIKEIILAFIDRIMFPRTRRVVRGGVISFYPFYIPNLLCCVHIVPFIDRLIYLISVSSSLRCILYL